MFYTMHDCFQHKQCTLKCMYKHLNLLKKNSGCCTHVPRFNRGGSENGRKGRGREKERRGEGKEKVEGMTEGRGGRHGEFG